MGQNRVTKLTTLQFDELDRACQFVAAGFGHPLYLVGTAGLGDGPFRDVDLRLILDDAEFAEVCPSLERWELLCVTTCAYLTAQTGLPIDFQIQRQSEANEKFGGQMRNPMGLTVRGRRSRAFAGGGDATPDWDGGC